MATYIVEFSALKVEIKDDMDLHGEDLANEVIVNALDSLMLDPKDYVIRIIET